MTHTPPERLRCEVCDIPTLGDTLCNLHYEEREAMSTHTPGRFHLIQYETDEYPTHCKADARIIGADGLCYGILFGGEDSYPDIEKIRMAHAFIVRACNSHEAMLEALKAVAALPGFEPSEVYGIKVKEAIRLAEGRA